MSRNMITAQKVIFDKLDGHCAAAGDAVANSGSPRWISGTSEDSAFLADAQISHVFRVTPRRIIARLDFKGRTFFSTLGLQGVAAPTGLEAGETTPGLVSVLLAEGKPRPVATALEIKNVVEFTDSNQDPSYDGHDYTVIAKLFGEIEVFEGKEIAESETWRAYYEICLGYVSFMDTWIEEDTTETLKTLTDLSELGLPYQILCRALFDADPAGLFLALYRCLEAIYAFAASTRIASALGFTGPWKTVAIVLEQQIGWRPREESSLAELFAKSTEVHLCDIFECFGDQRPDIGENLAEMSAKKTYKLRNHLVHYRPIHHTFEHKDIQWNNLCITLSKIILDVYYSVFMPASAA